MNNSVPLEITAIDNTIHPVNKIVHNFNISIELSMILDPADELLSAFRGSFLKRFHCLGLGLEIVIFIY